MYNGPYLFDWDEANIAHMARHGVTPEEVEQALVNDPTDADEYEEKGEIRYSQIGMTDAHRCLVIVTTWRGDRLRVVTAFPGSSAEAKFYLKPRRRR